MQAVGPGSVSERRLSPADVRRLAQQLVHPLSMSIGARPAPVDAAMDANRIIAAWLGDDVDGAHPLAGWAHTLDTAHMLAWALNGTGLQAVDRPEYTLRSLAIRPGKSPQMRLLAGVSAEHGGDTDGLQLAVQRISLDPKVTSSRWWPAETDD